MQINFEHHQSAHCENGVTSNLFRFGGQPKITEPLAFGLGSGLFFIYIPFIKINNGPMISYRTMPGYIFKRTCKSLGVPIERKKFSSHENAQQFLDDLLAKGQPAGCQVGVYYLPYFPKEYRFHFNAHNIVVYGKENGTYLVSDPVMETVTTLTEFDLDRVRFAKGPLAPSGQVYYPNISKEITDDQIRLAIQKGVKLNVRHMLYIPGPIAGISGIRYTAKKIEGWREKLGPKQAGVYLAQLVRMQEEIGTGGGGFRFIYAAFLQQSYAYIPKDELLKASEQFTKAGDLWRSSAVQAAGIFKGRLSEQKDYKDMSNLLFEIAKVEEDAFKALHKIKW